MSDVNKNQILYIIQAALEYLVALLVSGSFLATLTKEIGVSDSVTGILSSVISLGCLFQLLSIIYTKRRVKGFVIIMSLLNQLLFASLYLIPLMGISGKFKIPLFIIAIFTAYFIYNLAHPKKINWLMSLVDDNVRGLFTANKEIVSLISGMVFSFLMSAIVDYYMAGGKTKAAFIVSGVVLLVLTLLHTYVLMCIPEKESSVDKSFTVLQTVKNVFSNRKVIRVTLLFVFYNISVYVSTPFYGTYAIGELGFSLKYVSLLVILSSVARILVSRFWGKYADKKSFAIMIEKCFLFLALAYLAAMFTAPGNGRITFLFYYIFNGIAAGGINSALINLVFDYVPYENRADSLAVSQAVAGLVGFITTVAASPLVSYIQNNQFKIFGTSIYAQQILSFLALFLTVSAAVYLRKMFIKFETK